ncbi:hypothetical protein ACFSC3_15200 [Sphingomonas floccifaciens]|uniref:Secreted protein n=2 Tax=Sphingomonas floccifaciens TaxID=1844115 RepID=A0ABW4NFQ2_9SPHN
MRLVLAVAIAAVPAAAYAQEQGSQPPQRIRSITIQPGEKCPESTASEVVVCAPPDQDQYRIPKALRDEPKTDVQSISQSVRMERVMEDNRRVLPGSCSPIGMNGQSGCGQKAAEAWIAEKRAIKNGQPVTPND